MALAGRIEAAWKAGVHDLRVDTGAGVFRLFSPMGGGYRVLLDGSGDAEDFSSRKDAIAGVIARVGDGPCLLETDRPVGRRKQDAESFQAVLDLLEWVDAVRLKWAPLVPGLREARGADAFGKALAAADAGRCDLLLGFVEGRENPARLRVDAAPDWARFAAVHRVLRPTPEVRHWADAQFVRPVTEPAWPRLFVERVDDPRSGGFVSVVLGDTCHRVAPEKVPHDHARLSASLMVSTAGVQAKLYQVPSGWAVEVCRWEADLFHDAADSDVYVSANGKNWAPGELSEAEFLHGVPV